MTNQYVYLGEINDVVAVQCHNVVKMRGFVFIRYVEGMSVCDEEVDDHEVAVKDALFQRSVSDELVIIFISTVEHPRYLGEIVIESNSSFVLRKQSFDK